MKVLLNALIIIIIAHIILINMEDNNSVIELMNKSDTPSSISVTSKLDYLLDEDDDTDNLLEFLNTQEMLIKPSNYYEEENKLKEVEKSNVKDLNKYFHVSDNDEIKLKPNKSLHNNTIDWQYKDEQVGNGGEFIEGVTAFDGVMDDYATI
tara:strand:- start:468 stop:920 length:453 start_codon:yes stop_codon:yes gene_type:complete